MRTVCNENLKKLIAAAAAFVTLTSGCSGKENIELTMEEPPWRQVSEEEMEKKYPNIDVIRMEGTEYGLFDVNMELDKRPIITHYFFTEIEKISNSGKMADITDYMNEYGFVQAMNPQLLDLVTRDGRIYAIPYEAYALGIIANIELFEAAGLVNADGTLIFPSTYEEFAQTANIIKEKTGKAGLAFPIESRYGGWLFMPIAWSYGVEFIEKKSDGTLRAAFDTPECVAALQYVKDLKWKYNALTDKEILDMDEMRQVFSEGEAAMIIAAPPNRPLMEQYKMDRNLIACCRMPAGPAGRYTLMGGNLYAISANASEEQIKAAFDWFEAIGFSPKVTDEMINTWERTFARDALDGVIVTEEDIFKIWVNPDTVEKQRNARKKYQNVDMKNYTDYTSFEDVIIRQEYSVCCQELYEVLDLGVQEVFRNENADVEQIVHTMAEKFQAEYLDNVQ